MKGILSCCAVALGLLCCSAGAAVLVTRGTVTSVTNTAGNTPSFAIQATSTSAPVDCLASPYGAWIVFKQENMPSDESFRQAFAIAMDALLTGRKVSIYSYDSGISCASAVYIQIDGQ